MLHPAAIQRSFYNRLRHEPQACRSIPGREGQRPGFYSRRSVLGLAAALSACVLPEPARAADNADIVAGAIRWDAWYQRTDQSLDAQYTMSAEPYRFRAPVHCRLAAEQLACSGSQQVMDAEIAAAADSGLKYWAFDWFPGTSSFRTAWNLYQASALRDRINWCGIVPLNALGSVSFGNGQWRAQIAQWAALMMKPGYQRLQVGDRAGRPLLYIFFAQAELDSYFDGRLDNVAVAFDHLRQLLAERGSGAPYIVMLDPLADRRLVTATRADAMSNYIADLKPAGPDSFAALDRQAAAYWRRLAASGAEMVPIAHVGWDTRPRRLRPVPWEKPPDPPRPDSYFEAPTPAEFADHIARAIAFIRAHPGSCPAKALLIYSWDECDEGGCMMPTMGDPSGSYLRALRRQLG